MCCLKARLYFHSPFKIQKLSLNTWGWAAWELLTPAPVQHSHPHSAYARYGCTRFMGDYRYLESINLSTEIEPVNKMLPPSMRAFSGCWYSSVWSSMVQDTWGLPSLCCLHGAILLIVNEDPFSFFHKSSVQTPLQDVKRYRPLDPVCISVQTVYSCAKPSCPQMHK